MDSIAGLSEPQWSSDGRTLTVVGNTPMGRPGWVFGFRVDPRSGAVTMDGAKAFPMRDDDLVHVGPTRRTYVERAEAYRVAMGDVDRDGFFPIGAYWAADDLLGRLYWRRDTQELRYADPAGTATDLGYRNSDMPDADLVRDGQGRVVLAATGFRAALDPVEIRPTTPYSTPIFDAATGAIAGTLETAAIRLDDPRLSAQADRLNALIDRHHDVALVAASASAQAGSVVALARRVSGDVVIFGAAGNAPAAERAIDCGPYVLDAAPIAIRRTDWGEAAHPLPVTMYDREGADTLVIYLHGGPSVQAQGANIPLQVYAYLEAGFSVAVVEYSGSAGGPVELVQRIRVQGPEAQQRDAAFLSRAVTTERARYGRIGIHGDSFGGSLLTQPGLIGSDFLIGLAPYLVHRDPETWTVRRRRGEDLRRARAQAAAQFGAPGTPQRIGFEQALSENLAAWRPDAPTLIVMGDRDDFSRPEDIAAAAGAADLRRLVIPRGNHGTVFQDPRTNEAIRALLDSVPVDEPTRR